MNSRTENDPWSKVEIEALKALYPDNNNDIVALAVGRSVSAVSHKAHRLGIKKSPAFLASRQSGRYRVKVSLYQRLVNYFRQCLRTT